MDWEEYTQIWHCVKHRIWKSFLFKVLHWSWAEHGFRGPSREWAHEAEGTVIVCYYIYVALCINVLLDFSFSVFQKVSTVRKLCKACNLDSKGSRMDLITRLRDEMKTRHTYDKIFQKIWGASGKGHTQFVKIIWHLLFAFTIYYILFNFSL